MINENEVAVSDTVLSDYELIELKLSDAVSTCCSTQVTASYHQVVQFFLEQSAVIMPQSFFRATSLANLTSDICERKEIFNFIMAIHAMVYMKLQPHTFAKVARRLEEMLRPQRTAQKSILPLEIANSYSTITQEQFEELISNEPWLITLYVLMYSNSWKFLFESEV